MIIVHSSKASKNQSKEAVYGENLKPGGESMSDRLMQGE